MQNKASIRYDILLDTTINDLTLSSGKEHHKLHRNKNNALWFEGTVSFAHDNTDFIDLVFIGTCGDITYIDGRLQLWHDDFELVRYDFHEIVSNGQFSIQLQGLRIKPAIEPIPQPQRVAMLRPESMATMDESAPPIALHMTHAKPPVKDGGEVTVFYGTTRNRTGKSDVNDYYGSDLTNLQLGTCTISIPDGHKTGAIERPMKIFGFSLRKESTSKDVVLTAINELSTGDFNTFVRDHIAGSDLKSALVFIHGFNVTFAEAAWRAGQLAHDMPFNGVTGFFSWPSAGSAPDYIRDIERADASVPALVSFIENLVDNAGVEQLHFLAHSMGNRVLTGAMELMFNNEAKSVKLKAISQLVLAAPDLDKDVFKNRILPAFRKIGTRRTLYASDKDMALALSRKLRDGLTRLGQAGNDIFVADGMDTVDASNVLSEGLHHSYIFETEQLLKDLYEMITDGLEPSKRDLQAASRDGINYWLFP